MSRFLLTLGLAAMNMCWVAPWAVLLGAWTDLARPQPLLSAASIFAIVTCGALSAQFLGRRAAHHRAAVFGVVGLGVLASVIAVWLDQYSATGGFQRLIDLVVAVALMFGQVSGPALAFGLGLLLWWQGVRLGSQSASYPDIEGAFRWGIGWLISFALVLGVTTRPSQLPVLESRTTPFVVGFFFVSLITLALGRLESLRTRTRALGVNGQWLGVLIAVSGLIILFALLVGQLLAFDLLIVVTRPLFDLLGLILLVVIYVIVIPLAWLVELLVYALLSLLEPNTQGPPPSPPQPTDIENLLQRLLSQGIPPELQLVLKAAAAAIVLAIVLLVIARAVARWRPSSAEADATQEERDSVWEPGRLRKLLLDWLRNLLRRFAAGELSATGVAPPPPPQSFASLSEGSVRELYRRLLRLGESAGAHRATSATPLEHLPLLEQSLEPEADLAALTSAYVEVRYAEQEPASSAIATLRDTLERVHPRVSVDS